MGGMGGMGGGFGGGPPQFALPPGGMGEQSMGMPATSPAMVAPGMMPSGDTKASPLAKRIARPAGGQPPNAVAMRVPPRLERLSLTHLSFSLSFPPPSFPS